jgi:hypothetical protein
MATVGFATGVGATIAVDGFGAAVVGPAMRGTAAGFSAALPLVDLGRVADCAIGPGAGALVVALKASELAGCGLDGRSATVIAASAR